MICPHCVSGNTKRRGTRGYNQRWSCNSCGKYYQTPQQQDQGVHPRILLFDIETSLMEVYVWGLYKQRIPHTNIIKDKNGKDKGWYVLSWSAKWLYDDEILSDIVTPKEARARNDRRVLLSIHKLLEEAEIVIAHNGDRFDLRKLNARFIDNDIDPPSPFKSIDTLKICRREFAFSSHKQDYLTKHFRLPEKLDTSFDLWIRCMRGDKKALDKMQEYNRHDVMGLEQVYLKIRPFIKNHPNLGVLLDMDVCTNCGSKDLDETDAVYLTSANKFMVYRCGSCTTPFIRHKKNNNQRPTNIRSVAR